MQVTNGLTSAPNPDTDIILDVEDFHAPNIQRFTGSDGPVAVRASRIGGVSAISDTGASGVWRSTANNPPLENAYPLATIRTTGNTRFEWISPASFREWNCLFLPVPVAYDPTLEGDLSALPESREVRIVTCLRKGSSTGRLSVGFQNQSNGGIFDTSFAAGAAGAMFNSPDGSTQITQIAMRGNAALSGAPTFRALASPVECVAAAVLFDIRAFIGRTFSMEFRLNGVLVDSVGVSDFGYANLNSTTGYQQLFMYPNISRNNTIVRGPYYSRATMFRRPV